MSYRKTVMVLSCHYSESEALSMLYRAARRIKDKGKTKTHSVQIHQIGQLYEIRLYERK